MSEDNFKKLLEQQMQLIQLLTLQNTRNEPSASAINPASTMSALVPLIYDRMVPFVYDPDNNLVFDLWYKLQKILNNF